jgi:tetratricopeptide (TPR) repeat protein
MDCGDYVSQGQEFARKGDYQSAVEAFEKARELNRNPDNAGLLEEMIDGLKRAISFQQQESQAAVNEAKHRAEIMGIQVEDVDKVIAEYTEALNCSPNDDSLKNSLANVYYIRGVTCTSKRDHARAIADYNEAIKLNQNYPFAFNKRGQEYLDNGDFDQAIADFEALRRFNWDENKVNDLLARAYMERGIAYDRKGDYTHAIPDFEKVLQFNPDNNTARELLEMAQAEKAKH